MTPAQQDMLTPDPMITMSTGELEYFLLFAIAVAGKNAVTTEKAVKRFLALETADNGTPFMRVRKMLRRRTLLRNLRRARLGRYGVLRRAYEEVVRAKLDLRTCTVANLEDIHGVGPKTSRFFILHSRPGERLAVLDTHILKYLASSYPMLSIPRSTPSGRRYLQLEKLWLQECDTYRLTPAEMDSMVWRYYVEKQKGQPLDDRRRS
jgi:hypothetical protein